MIHQGDDPPSHGRPKPPLPTTGILGLVNDPAYREAARLDEIDKQFDRGDFGDELCKLRDWRPDPDFGGTS